MNRNILISVVVPVYNTEKYLIKCLNSILNQTYKNLQIILVDDGSTDNSGHICDEYALKDDRIQVIHKANGGLVSARKAGLKLATGEYVSNIDSDDWLEPNMYEEMLDNLLQTGADFVNTGVIYVYINKNDEISEVFDCNFETIVIDNPKMNVDIWKGFLYHYDKMFLNSYLWSKLFKRDFFISCYENLPDESNYGEDRITLTECILKCQKISFLKKCYYHYVSKRAGSYTAKRGLTGVFWAARMYEEIFKLFKKYNIYEAMQKYLDSASVTRILWAINDSDIYPNKIPVWRCKIQNSFKNKKIIIYGASQVGRDYYNQLIDENDIHIVGWVDKNFHKYNYIERRVDPVISIKNADYDLILIAVTKQGMAKQISDELLSLGVDEDKIFWQSPMQVTDCEVEENND